jgi:hypothetical protein
MAENFDDMEKRLKAQAKLGEDLRKSTAKMAGSMKDYLELQLRLNRSRKEEQKLQEKINKLKEESGGIITDEIREHEQLLKKLKQENKELQKGAKILKSQTLSIKNMSVAVSRDLLKGLKSVTKEAKKLSLEYFEQESIIRRTSVNVGIIGKQQQKLRSTLYKNALITQRWGMDAAQLGETYGSYVDNVGRLVQLTDEGSRGLAKMAMGTVLGKEGAAELASNMEVFGKSIEGTTQYVEDTLKYSHKMGVNSGKVLKTLSSNMRQANTVRFKDGIKGIMKMATLSTKLRMNMDEVLGLAQDLWEPERAIEVGASLQMMGGAFAKMGDPLKLMYQGRNDPAQLQEDLANAAAESIKFNKATGEFDTSSMELHRLKTVAQELGMNFENIVELAKTTSKQNLIGRMLDPRISKEGKSFIESVASVKNGEFVVTVGNDTKKVSDLTQKQIEVMMQHADLEQRAKESQSFMGQVSNFLKSFKSLAFRFIKGFDDALGDPIRRLLDSGQGGLLSFGDKLEKWGNDFGKWIGDKLIPALQWMKNGIPKFIEAVRNIGQRIGEFFKSEGWEDIKQAGIRFADVGKLLMKGFKWIYDTFGAGGVLATMLLIKFPGILKGAFSMLTGGIKGMFSMFTKARGSTPMNPMFVANVGGGGMGGPGGGGGMGGLTGGKSTFGRRQMLKMFGKKGSKNLLGFGSKLGKGFKAFTGLGMAGLAMDIGRSFLENPNSDAGKALGIGGTMLGDAGTGAMIGSVIPGVGTLIGSLIGGVVGLGRGMYNEFSEHLLGEYDLKGKIKPHMSMGLGGASVATMADGTVDPKGNVIATKSGELWNTSPGDYIHVSRPNGAGSAGGSSNMNLRIDGTLKLDSNGTTVDASRIINDPIFVSELTRVITKTMKTQNR